MALFGWLLNFLIIICSLFLICIVLIQRGRGGGLAGAFGGLGGSSAFGTKAGDVFTKVTVVTAVIWFLLAMALVIVNNRGRSSAFDDMADRGGAREVTPTETGATPGTAPPATTGQETPAAGSAGATPSADPLGLPPALDPATDGDEVPAGETPKDEAPAAIP